MLFSSASDSTPINERTVNILCLHGKGGNGHTFQKTLEPLWEQLRISTDKNRKGVTTTDPVPSFKVDYLTAPFPVSDEPNGGTQWWTLPPGTRSFNAPSYDGFDLSADLLQKALRTESYDIVLAHSQGSILVSALMGTKPPEWWGPVHAAPVGCVLNGCAWPNPYAEEMDNLWPENGGRFEGAIGDLLFVIGSADGINPPEGAIRVRDCFDRAGVRVDSCGHAGGHSVPVGDGLAVREICDWILKLVGSQ